MEVLLIILFFWWLLPILICHQLGIARMRTGWLWGFWLGWLGVLILACMRPVPLHQRLAIVEADAEAERQLELAAAWNELGRRGDDPGGWLRRIWH